MFFERFVSGGENEIVIYNKDTLQSDIIIENYDV